VYFSSENRVDFRELVRKLASAFRIRIELRQIGARDECRMLGGISPCGRVCCCKAHLGDYTRVSIKMAKNQNLSLNPAKISGLCGRLMCCLEYENAHYVETNKRMPRVGATVTTKEGKEGQVISLNQIKETVRLKIFEKEVLVFSDIPLADVIFHAKGAAAPAADASVTDELETDNISDEELKALVKE
jgi:cell fate regulator YaaT (PSP1 superfamily)